MDVDLVDSRIRTDDVRRILAVVKLPENFTISDEAKSRVIEHLLWRFPAPTIYALERCLPDGTWINQVFEGAGFLIALRDFFLNKYVLTGVSDLDLVGKRYSDLKGRHQFRLDDTLVHLCILKSDLVPEVWDNLRNRAYDPQEETP